MMMPHPTAMAVPISAPVVPTIMATPIIATPVMMRGLPATIHMAIGAIAVRVAVVTLMLGIV